MNVVVTGAAGFIGSHMAEALSQNGHTVTGIDRFSDYYPPVVKQRNTSRLAACGVPVLRIDLAKDSLVEMLAGADAVIHLAAQPGLATDVGYEPYLLDNIIATQRLVEAAQVAPRLKAFLHVSTSSVYGRHADGDEESAPKPVSHYGVTKLAAEQFVLAAQRNNRLPASVFRLYSVYGPRERPDKLLPRLIDALATDRPFPLYAGSEHHQRSFTFVSDAVAGLMAGLNQHQACEGEIFNLGNPAAVTTREFIAAAEQLMGRRLRVEQRPPRSGDQTSTRANISKIRRILGFEPVTSIHDGLTQTIAAYEWDHRVH